MTTQDGAVFRVLALCAQRPGQPQIVERLPRALAALPPGIDLVAASEQHGLAGLVLAHIREAKVSIPPAITVGLFARYKWHARAATVRRRIVGEALEALAQARIPLLVLKGAALAHLVYADSACRPMRDVDLLVRPQDARRGYEILRGIGFVPSETPTGIDHHHLQGIRKTEDETTILIELHHQLLPPAALVEPVRYDDLAPAAQTFEWSGLALQTLGREDMVWHVYEHGFAINPVSPELRLSSLADLVHTVEAWVDLLDWDLLRRRRWRMIRALRVVHDLVPWSDRVARALDLEGRQSRGDTRSLHDWSFRMRYGIESHWQEVWYRRAGHPLRMALDRGGFAARRLVRRLTGRPGPTELDD